MTCIVGIADGRAVWLGADSNSSNGISRSTRLEPKVFSVGRSTDNFVIGFAGSWRMGQLLRFGLKKMKPPKGRSLNRFMAIDFIDAVRDSFSAHGWLMKREAQDIGGTFLIGVRGRLFTVHDDFQVGEPADLHFAIGSGELAARGALFASKGLDPRKRMMIALQASQHIDAHVRGPFRRIVGGWK